jgi:hypothetical protein
LAGSWYGMMNIPWRMCGVPSFMSSSSRPDPAFGFPVSESSGRVARGQ